MVSFWGAGVHRYSRDFPRIFWKSLSFFVSKTGVSAALFLWSLPLWLHRPVESLEVFWKPLILWVTWVKRIKGKHTGPRKKLVTKTRRTETCVFLVFFCTILDFLLGFASGSVHFWLPFERASPHWPSPAHRWGPKLRRVSSESPDERWGQLDFVLRDDEWLGRAW